MARSSARIVRTKASIAAHEDGSLRLAVVADTHSAPHAAIAKHLTALRPDAILHAGDIGELAVLDRLAQIAPVFAVRGNIDGVAADVPDVLTLDVTPPPGGENPGAGSPGVMLRILMLHIAVYGPKLRAEVARMARAEDASLVVCGHSHVPFMSRDGDLTVFNPGSIGPRRFHLPIVFGTIDISPSAIRLTHVDCETGRPWRPAARGSSGH